MNKQALIGVRHYFDMVHGVTLRLIGSFSDEDLDYRPKPGMRSVRELIAHVYTQERVLAEGVKSGKLTLEVENQANPETEDGKKIADSLSTIAEAQAYARESHKAAGELLNSLTDEQIASPVEAPYGTFPAWQFFSFAYDEHWHHRGQLYTYARLLGKEPPMLYSYEENEA
jgi:uncharacterized damage-inducible protein DinB